MTRRSSQKPEAAVTATPATDAPATDTQSADTNTAGTENSAPADVPAGPTIEERLNAPPADACETWGVCDLSSRACKSCPVKEDCRVLTADRNVKTKAVGTPKERKARAVNPGDGTRSPFSNSKSGTEAGAIDCALNTPRTMAELITLLGVTESRIKSHMKWLVDNKSASCTKIVNGDKYHFEAITA